MSDLIASTDIHASFRLGGKPEAALSDKSGSPEKPCEHSSVSAIVGECDAIRDLRTQIVQITTVDKSLKYPRPVMVVGETGTGKQLVACALHCQGPRANRPFVEVNCAAIPSTLLEAELFGFEKGAFTDARTSKPGLFEQANGGTLFLDEICSMDPMLQVKLLKAIEQRSIRRLGGTMTKNVDVRIIAASNWVAEVVSRHNGLRPDLYYRLSSFCLTIPPLRERGRDILVLAHHVLERLGCEAGHRPKRLTKDAEILLLEYAWPGNVRELINVLERAALLNCGNEVDARNLEIRQDENRVGHVLNLKEDGHIHVDFASVQIDLESIERQLIMKALVYAKWSRGEAAKLLGISKETLRYRIEKFDLRPDHSPQAGLGQETARPISHSINLPM